MARTPGIVVPKSFPVSEKVLLDLKRRATQAGYTPIVDVAELKHMALDDFLAHHGVKGMKWGVIRDDIPGGESSSGSTDKTAADDTPETVASLGSGFSAKVKPKGTSDADMREFAEKLGADSDQLRARYGPNSVSKSVAATSVSTKTEKQMYEDMQKNASWYGKLSDNQKTAIKVAGAAAAIGGLLYLNHKYGDKLALAGVPDYMKHYTQTKMNQAKNFDPDSLSTKGISYAAGHIFQRVSTEEETTIRPEGFFAAGEKSDVERYKAILPAYWGQWGLDAKEGHVVSLKANTEIRSPSPRAVFDYYKKNVAPDELDFVKAFRPNGKDDIDSVARQGFHAWAGGWAAPDRKTNTDYFKYLKENGYNAVIDMNDEGVLGKTPMRMIDGSIFSIDKTERLSQSAIQQAREALIRDPVIHAMMFGGITMDDILDMDGDEFFEHMGVKGMKWGVRNQRKLDSVNAVLDGTATRKDKRRAANQISLAAVIRNKGSQGALQRRGAQLELRKQRIEKGEATIKDYLALHGGDAFSLGGKAR